VSEETLTVVGLNEVLLPAPLLFKNCQALILNNFLFTNGNMVDSEDQLVEYKNSVVVLHKMQLTLK